MHTLYPWQLTLLSNPPSRGLILAPRQAGKTEFAVRLAVQVAKSEPGENILIVSSNQSTTAQFKQRLFDQPIDAVPSLPGIVELSNGSRIYCTPDDVISPDRLTELKQVRLAIFDEAARCFDELMNPIIFLANLSPRGQVIALTTPAERQGWFWREWNASDWNWIKSNIKPHMCPNLTPGFLAHLRKELSTEQYAREIECQI